MISDVGSLSVHLVGNLVSQDSSCPQLIWKDFKPLLDAPGPCNETDSRFFVARNPFLMKARTYVLCFCSESKLLALLITSFLQNRK